MRFRHGRSTSINADDEISHGFLMVEPLDAGGIEDDKQKVTTLNYLREPLLDDID